MAGKVKRIFTGLAGLPVCQEPHKELAKVYGRLLRRLEDLPSESQYRITVEKLVKDRTHVLETTQDPAEVEKKIGAGLCEELIEQAKAEIELVQTMKEYKPWEPLEEKPTADQWKWPL